MIELEQADGKTLVVNSTWDSGIHKGVNVAVCGECWSDIKTLDKVLTKEQIKGLEAIIGYTVKCYIEDNSKLEIFKK